MKKRTFLMYADHYEMVKGLNDAQLGTLLRALYALANNEPLPELDAVAKMAFAFISNDVLKANAKYEERCEKNREAIAHRWDKSNTNVYNRIQSNTNEYECIQSNTNVYNRIQSNTNEYECIQSNTNEYNRIQSNTNVYLYDNDNDNDNDDDINNNNNNKDNNNNNINNSSSNNNNNKDTNVENKDSNIIKLTAKEKEKFGKEKEKQSEKNAVVKLKAENKKADKEARARKFYNSLLDYLDKYGAAMLREFYDYWTESNEGGALMRFEMERVFDVSRRLATWKRNENTKKGGRNYGNFKTATERLRDEYADTLDSVLAKYRKQ